MSATESQFLLALAPALTGLLALAAAILTFFVQRAVARSRTLDKVYNHHLEAITATGIYVVANAAVCWWTWAAVAPDSSTLLFSWPASTWFVMLFAPLVALGAGSAGVAGFVRIRRLKRDLKAGWHA
jgi:TRAP-type C4-dicarboxylate transport system permease large subunit